VGQSAPQPALQPIAGGRLKLRLTHTPVYVVPR